MIRTVLGDIDNQKGNVLMHEHIQCVSNDMLAAFGKRWLDEEILEGYAVSILKQLKERLSLGIYVDGTSIDLGRNVKLIKSISEKTGVHIVASTGFYYYPSMVSCLRSAEELAEWIWYECENGMEGTEIKPGILKCAGEGNELTPDMEKRIKALSTVQAKTKLPMYAHCSHKEKIAYEMMDIFEKNNVNPEKTVLGHASRRLDADYLESLVREGYCICIDQAFDGSEEEVAQTVFKLCERGFENKLLFSHDRPLYNDFGVSSELGLDYPEDVHIQRYSFFRERLIPEFLKLGCTEEQCELFLRENGVKVLNF